MKLIIVLVFATLSTISATAQMWTPSISNRAIFSVAVNPQNPQTMYAGNQARIFYRSLDGGDTWDEFYIGDFGGASQLSLMMVHPVDTAVVFAGGLGLDGLVRSPDMGASWETVLLADDLSRLELGGAGALAIDPQQPSTMYAIRFQNGEVYRSTTTGEDWELISTVPGLATTDHLRAITVDPTDSDVLLAAGRRAHIMRSKDGGITWDSTDMSGITLQRDEDVAQFAWSPSTPGTVFATVQRSLHPLLNSAGMYRSIDNGQTWERWRFVDTSLYAIAIRPGFYGDEILVGGNQVDFPSDSGYIRGDSIVLHTTNGGGTWEDISNVPWMENEIGDVGANIWGFAWGDLQPSIPESPTFRMFMATNGGLFYRDITTSVDESAAAAPILLPAIAPVTPIVRYDQNRIPAERYVIRNLQGRIIEQQQISTPGQIVLPEGLRGTYSLEIIAPTQRIHQLIQR